MSLVNRSSGATRQAKWIHRRSFSTTPRQHLSPLFALGALSNARETQHLAKESRLSRIQHSPNLQLIESSEVTPFAPAKPPPVVRPTLTPNPQIVPAKPSESKAPTVKKQPDKLSEAEILNVGQAILAEKNAEISSLRQKLKDAKERLERREATYATARTRNRERIATLHGDLSSEKRWKWILLTLGAAAAGWYTYSAQDPTRNRSVSYSFGNEYLGKKAARKIEEKAEQTPPALLSEVDQTIIQPSPAIIATPSPVFVEESHPSRLGRLFWRS